MSEERREVFEGYGDDGDALPNYAALAGLFNLILAAFFLVTCRSNRALPERISPGDIALLGVATHKLSLLLSKDAVTSPLRAPFTELQDKQSPKKLKEKPRGGGLRRSVGELLTCQFCVGQWVASFFTYGLVLAPAATRLVASISAVVTVSDHLHQTYKALVKRA